MTDTETAEPPAGYRLCVGIMLLNAQGLVFVGQRGDASGDAWQMPQGGIDRGESVVAAGLREMREEIGTDRAELLAETASGARMTCPSPGAAPVAGPLPRPDPALAGVSVHRR